MNIEWFPTKLADTPFRLDAFVMACGLACASADVGQNMEVW